MMSTFNKALPAASGTEFLDQSGGGFGPFHRLAKPTGFINLSVITTLK
jgi:hypothetical protein